MATGKRRVSSYKPVQRSSAVTNNYPSGSSALIGALHDVRYYQGLLSNADNYAKVSSFEVFEVVDGRCSWQVLAGEADCRTYIDVSLIASTTIELVLNVQAHSE